MKIPKIERIYSRKRICFSNLRKKEIKIAILLLVIIMTISISWHSTEPMIRAHCREIAIAISSEFASQEVKKMADIYDYDDLSVIEMDEQRNVKMIKINVGLVNGIMADIEDGVQKGLDQYDEEEFSIRLGSFTGSKILSGRGPKVKIKIQTAGNVQTELKSEFTSQGINQTLHRLYVNVICTTVVYTPFCTTQETIENQVLLAEAVIVGNIPENYYSIEGIEEEDTLPLVD